MILKIISIVMIVTWAMTETAMMTTIVMMMMIAGEDDDDDKDDVCFSGELLQSGRDDG